MACMERMRLVTYAIVPAAVVGDLVAALVLSPVWGLGYVESLRGLLFLTGLGLMFLGGLVGGSGRIVMDWRTQYVSSHSARALAEHNVRRMSANGEFLTITILAGLALFFASFFLRV
jgi:hypothetical protein